MSNRGFLFLVFLGFGLAGFAQNPGYRISAKPMLGYEMNLLKSPSSYNPSDSLQMGMRELWANAPYVGVDLGFVKFSLAKKHQLNVEGLYRKALFTTIEGVDAAQAEATIGYRYKPSKKFQNNLEFTFRDYNKTGEDQDNLLGIPLSYRSFKLQNEADRRLGKRAHLIFGPFFQYKNYKWAAFDRFMYTDAGADLVFNYNYRMKKKVGWMVDAGFHQRNYFIEKMNNGEEQETDEELEEEEFMDDEGEEEQEFEEEEEDDQDAAEIPFEEETRNRIWRYYSVGVGTKIPLNKKWKLTSRLGYTHRTDIIQESLGYHQFMLQAGLVYKFKNWKCSWVSTVYHRRYTDFTFTANAEESLLVYTYWKNSLNLSYEINKKLSLLLSASTKNRFSNANDPSRRIMRSYFIGDFSAGLVWEFGKTHKPKVKTKK